MNICSSRFEGHLFELKGYSMVMIDTSSWLSTIVANKAVVEHQLLVGFHESELLLAWCIREGIKRGVPEVRLLEHYHDSRFEAVYDQLFYQQEFVLRNRILPALQTFGLVKAIRVLPMLDKTIIAIGT